ncbi:MAG: hypothetical protein GXP16_09075 [Gammaproteobacteria bacterium]|nr:hypothetical protein [Gammaproteobacteria bacterium]
MDDRTAIPIKHWSMSEAVKQIAACNFNCEAGPLHKNDAWNWLTGAAEIGPDYWPGQGVWFEIEAEAAGKELKQMVHFFIVGCQMESGADSRYWVYDLSYDPPAPYHYGTVHFRRIPGASLHLTNPAN